MKVHEDALREIIARSGYSQAKFAAEAQMSPGQLSDILNGNKGASPELIKRMAVTLKCPLTAIIREPESQAS